MHSNAYWTENALMAKVAPAATRGRFRPPPLVVGSKRLIDRLAAPGIPVRVMVPSSIGMRFLRRFCRPIGDHAAVSRRVALRKSL